MSSLKSILGLVLLGLLVIPPGHAQDGETCPYPKGRKIQDLTGAIKAHGEWLEKDGPLIREIPGRANFCNADLRGAKLEGADLRVANLEGANLSLAFLKGANLSLAFLKGADLRWAKLEGARLDGADLEGADLTKANLQGHDLTMANLEGANLSEAKLQGARLDSANLEGANLSEANLKGIDLTKANLEGANLSDANLEGADLSQAILKGADLSQAILEGAKLRRTYLSEAILFKTIMADAELHGADLSGALYDPASLPRLSEDLSGFSSLVSVRFCKDGQNGLVQLRAAFKDAGLREREREATYAIERGKTRHALGRFDARCPGTVRGLLSDIEGVLRLVLFEWPTAYGLYPGRAILILLGLIGVFTLLYLPALVIAPKRPDDSGIFRIWPEGRIKPSGEGIEIADDATVDRLNARGIAALGLAIYFSVVSAFHIGWRDLNVGSWIARMQFREYALRAKGWVRAVSGVQSLISVYLIAMWALTYFGRPFE